MIINILLSSSFFSDLINTKKNIYPNNLDFLISENFQLISSYHIFFIFFIILSTFTIINGLFSKIIIEELINKSYKVKSIVKFIIKNIFSIIFPPYAILIIISFIYLLSKLIFFTVSLIFPSSIPFFILNIFYFLKLLFSLFSFIITLIAIIYSPIIFNLIGGDLFSIIFNNYLLLFINPIKLLIYTIFNILFSLICIILVYSLISMILNIINISFFDIIQSYFKYIIPLSTGISILIGGNVLIIIKSNNPIMNI